jgi:dienelactone hydrolase
VKFLIFICGVLAMSMTNLEAKVDLSKLEYKIEDKAYEATLARDSKQKVMKGAVVVFHNWMGVTAETESKITELAKLGYVAMAADLYGKGIRPKDQKQAGELAFALKENRAQLRQRVNAALIELSKLPGVDHKKMFATGYCFGGTAALELARSGAELLGVVSFHGGLSSPTPLDAKNIKSQILVYHGAIDPMVSASEVEAFKKEMDEAKVNYQFTAFANTVHSFTDKAAGSDLSKGVAYNALADKRSWQGMLAFFTELAGN